jgi:hypothetical protein
VELAPKSLGAGRREEDSGVVQTRKREISVHSSGNRVARQGGESGMRQQSLKLNRCARMPTAMPAALLGMLLAITDATAVAEIIVDDGANNFRSVAANNPALGNIWTSMAQSFTVPYSRISFGFRLLDTNFTTNANAGKPVIYNLYAGEIAPLTLLASRTVTFPSDLLSSTIGEPRLGDVGFVDADFSGVTLTPGEKYTVEITLPPEGMPAAGTQGEIGVWTSLVNPYDGGRFYFPLIPSNPVAGNNGFFSEQDMIFRIGDAVGSPELLIEDLRAEVAGVGPGGSLASKLRNVQAAYAAGDARAACAVLNAFMHQVRAQSGTNLTTEQADGFTEDAQRIANEIGCN